MANTRQSTKRALQAKKREKVNQSVESMTKSAVKYAVDAIKKGDLDKAKLAYVQAVKALSKAASKGTFPQGRVSRKIGRLTALVKKALPAALNFKN